MYKSPHRYLASVFLEANDVEFDFKKANEIQGLLKLPLEPTVLQEVFQETDKGYSEVKPRIGFMDSEDTTKLVLMRNRFDFSWHFHETNANKANFHQFIEDSAMALSRLLEYFSRNCTRIALVREGFIEGSSEIYNRFGAALYRLPTSFNDHDLFDYESRWAISYLRQFGKHQDLVNSIILIKRILETRASGSLLVTNSDRLRVDIDINTTHTNLANKYDHDDVRNFLQSAEQWHYDIEKLLVESYPDYLGGPQ